MEQFLGKLHHEKLIRFEIHCSRYDKGVGEYQLGNLLNLEGVNVDLLKKEATQYLLSRTEHLSLMEIYGLSNLVGELDGKWFVKLKKLTLKSCDIKCVVDATGFRSSGGGVFINLEELTIDIAKNLESLCQGNLPVGSFARLRKVILLELPSLRQLWGAIQLPSLGNLESLYMEECGSIRSVFLKSSVKCLLQLEHMHIQYCERLETVVSNGEDGDDTGNIEFPRLKTLVLKRLKSLRSFSHNLGREVFFSEKVMLPNLEDLVISDVNGVRCIVDSQMPLIGSLSNLERIIIVECDDLVHVASSNSIKLLQSLAVVSVRESESVKVVFDFTGAESLQTPVLACLEYLHLWKLPNLKHIWRMLPQGINAFQNLTQLEVSYCPKLRYLLSPSMATMLVSLQTLDIGYCAQMEAIIGVGEREIMKIKSDGNTVTDKEKHGEEESTNKIVFSKLTTVVVCRLDNFQMLCSATVDLELPLLTELVIKDCPRMTKFCVGQLSAPRLSSVEVTYSADKEEGDDANSVDEDEDKIKVGLDEFNLWLKDCESKIRCLKCSYLKKEVCDHLD